PVQMDRWYEMTGTSAAAGVVSAIAATAWAYAPTLAGPDLMDRVFDSGRKMNFGQTGVCLASAPPHSCDASHKVSLCRALNAACGAPCKSASCTESLAQEGDVPIGTVTLDPRPGAGPFPSGLADFAYGQPINPICPECQVVYDPHDSSWSLS